MSISSISKAINSLTPESIDNQNGLTSNNKVLNIFLSIVTLGIYTAYKNASNEKPRNELLDLGCSLLKFDPDCQDVPLNVKINGNSYELYNTQKNSILIRNIKTGQSEEIDGLSLVNVRDGIISEVLNKPDLFDDMQERIRNNEYTGVDLHVIKQQKANACGEASVAMIKKYFGVKYDPPTNNRPVMKGISIDELLIDLYKSGIISEACKPSVAEHYSIEDIAKGLQNGPLLCNLIGHAVIINQVNMATERIRICCPMLGNRECSLEDLNLNLEWDDKSIPLIQFKTNTSYNPVKSGSGEITDPNFKPSAIDRLGVGIVSSLYNIGNSWMKEYE